MFYKVKSVRFDKKNNQILVTAADSSLRPLHYLQDEYAKDITDFRAKCKSFWIDVITGCLQFIPSNKWFPVVDEAYQRIRSIAGGENVYRKDSEYDTHFCKQLNSYIAENYLVPLVMKEDVSIDADYEASFIMECQKEWNRIEKYRRLNRQIYVRTAIISYAFPGYVVLLDHKENRTIVAKSENYNNRGMLDDSDESAIILPPGSGDNWSLVGYASLETISDTLRAYPQLAVLCVPETEYQSEEYAVMHGYQKVFETDTCRIYATETANKQCSYAKIVGHY